MIPAPLLIRAAGAALVLGALGSGVAWWNHHEREIGRAEVRAEWQAANWASSRAAFRETERRFKEGQNAQDHHAADIRRVAAARDAARTEREQLRDAIADAERRIAETSDAEPACGTHAASAAGLQLLDACAGRYQELAGEAGELAATVTGLQRWISGICTESVAPSRDGGGRLEE